MNKIQYLTPEGLEKLKAELNELKTVRRREVAAKIEAAKALGDLSENAEYHEAKDEMVIMENRIFELEEILRNVSLIEEHSGSVNNNDAVRVGSTVVVRVLGKDKTFTIVGSNESDPLSGRISNESPIGSALLGKNVGEIVVVRTPTGMTEYQIISIT